MPRTYLVFSRTTGRPMNGEWEMGLPFDKWWVVKQCSRKEAEQCAAGLDTHAVVCAKDSYAILFDNGKAAKPHPNPFPIVGAI
jgi:hypothetical protein